MPEEIYTIDCPSCGAHFDCKEEIENWKIKLLQATNILKQIKEIAAKLK